MGNAPLSRQSEAVRQPIVAFDFDGTLTVSDSFTAFLRWRARPLRHTLGMIRLAPAAAAWLGHRDRGRIKAAAVREFLVGESREALEAQAETFMEAIWPRFMRPDALACWEDWGRRGAWRVIVTASPETTVAPFARRLGAEALLGTRLAFDADHRVTGAFDGANCRGDEKVRRLREAYGEDVRLAAAYGDTSGDREMLQIAGTAGYRVFTAQPAGGAS